MIGHLLLLILTIFQVSYGYLARKTVFVSQRNIRWAIFQLLRNCWSGDLQSRVPLMGRGDIQIQPGQRITAGTKGCPIEGISRCFFTSFSVWDGSLLCNKVTLPNLLVHFGRFSINAWFKLIIVDDSVVWVGSSSSNAFNSLSSHFCLLHWNRHC